MSSLTVIGTGRVGSGVAFLAAAMHLVDELVLHDILTPRLTAEVLDLQDTGTEVVITTDTRQIRETDIVVFAAGTPRNPGIRSRADLFDVNLQAVKSCRSLLKGFEGILITVTNPMDANNYILQRATGLDRGRCIGFGGQLDSARFARVLRSAGIMDQAWVLGEHGAHQVPIFSRMPQYADGMRREECLASLRMASMKVIKGKEGTVFGPAAHIVNLIRAVLEDRREVLPCSCVLEGEYGIDGCSIGVPARIGREGIIGIEEWDLDPWEREKFDEAGESIKDLCRREHG